MLQVKGLSCVRNEQTIFNRVSFKLGHGEILQIRGANGIGKTTLLKIVAGLFKATSGEIFWQNKSIKSNRSAYTKQIIYCAHKQNLHPILTVEQNLKYLCALNGNSVCGSAAISAALQYMNIAHKRTEACAELSAGQLQRVSLARLCLSSAKLWLLDEPLTNLDQHGKELLTNLCLQHLKNSGMIILATQHEFVLNNVSQYNLSLEDYVDEYA